MDSSAISVQTPGSTIQQATNNPTPLPPPSPILPETGDILQENEDLPSNTQCCHPVEHEDCNHTSTISPTDAPFNSPEAQQCPLIVDEVDKDSDDLPLSSTPSTSIVSGDDEDSDDLPSPPPSLPPPPPQPLRRS